MSLRYWSLPRPDAFFKLKQYRDSWEYRVQKEKERQLYNKAKEQNYPPTIQIGSGHAYFKRSHRSYGSFIE